MSDTSTSTASIVPAHNKAEYYLGTEEWLPVEIDGVVRYLGLEAVLRRAHEIENIALQDPLEKFAIIRYLVALTYLLYAYDPDGPWASIVSGAEPLPSSAIDSLISRCADRWWLFHPETPFAQIPELRQLASKKYRAGTSLEDATESYTSLIPYRPSKTNEAWWYRDSHVAVLTYERAALAVLVRHFAGLPGNEARLLVGTEEISRTEGGVMVSGPGEVSSLYLRLPNLAATLVGSLVSSIADVVTPKSVLFFEDPLRVANHIDDPLYLYTASSAASYLVQSVGAISRVLRMPVPLPKETSKQLMTLAKLSDPHVLRVENSNTPSINANKGIVAFHSEAAQYENLYELYRKLSSTSQHLRPSVLDTNSLAVRHSLAKLPLCVTTLKGAGTFTGGRVDDVTAATLESSPFTADAGSELEMRAVLAILAASSKSVLSTLRYSFKMLGGDGATFSETKLTSLYEKARRDVWYALDHDLASMYGSIALGASFIDSGLPSEVKKIWVDTACDAFSNAVSQYEKNPKSLARSINAANYLRSKLWSLL